MVYFFLADGFEESEAIVPIDILKRADITVLTVGVGSKTVVGAHGLTVTCDIPENEALTDCLEGIVLPGGMPGTLNLEKSETVQKFVEFADKKGLIIGAICAAPSVLGKKGILKGKKATCFTGFDEYLTGATVSCDPVVRDGNIVTAYGAGAAFLFGFSLLSTFKGEKTAEEIKKQMRYTV